MGNTAADCCWGAGSFWAAAAQVNLGIVIIGGLLGGLLQPIVAKLNPRADNPPAASFWQSPLLGLAAAGISVYVVAPTNTGEPVRLLFFALLCGLAFPAVLASAVDSVGKKTQQVKEQVERIAQDAQSDDVAEATAAGQKLRTALLQNPSDSVKPEGQEAIERAGQQAVVNIAQTPAPDAAAQKKIVDELQNVGTVASTAGWTETAQAAVDQLTRLSASIGDASVQQAAAAAASQLTDLGGG